MGSEMCIRDSLHSGSNCSTNFGGQCVKAFKAALGVYAPIQAVQLAVFRRDKLMAAPVATLLYALRVVLRSSTFLTSYSAGAWGVHCFTHTMLGLHSRWVLFVCGMVGGSSILIEPPTRRPEIALYVPCRCRGMHVTCQRGHAARLRLGALFGGGVRSPADRRRGRACGQRCVLRPAGTRSAKRCGRSPIASSRWATCPPSPAARS